MSRIEGVIFDMDGVLTDSEPVINAAALAGLREYGVRAEPEDFKPFVGMGEDRYIGGVAEKYGVPYSVEMKRRVYEIYLEILPSMHIVYPGVLELLCKLRTARYRLAVASSADRVKVVANLETAGVPLTWFGAVVTGEDVARKKPDPAIFLAAAARLDVHVERACVVEDSPSGVEAAKRAGMRCVGVAQTFDPPVLLAAGADCVRPTVADIRIEDLDHTAPRRGAE
ncbi:MAG: HAD-IA family hydrolase [Kiritimatiellaeota bacterium]|nr:HAD-IA family hydrolase [Kiritimatiellota bacterium]